MVFVALFYFGTAELGRGTLGFFAIYYFVLFGFSLYSIGGGADFGRLKSILRASSRARPLKTEEIGPGLAWFLLPHFSCLCLVSGAVLLEL